MDLEIPILRPLRTADIPGAIRLKDLAGWNQVEEDWALFLEVSPGGAFALERRGEVIATSTAIPYGRAFGWVGMMLVHPDERRKGHGARMLEAAISFLEERGCIPALDATAMGKPLYERYGFQDLFAIERWIGPAPKPSRISPTGCRRIDPAGLDAVLPLDAECFGADRKDVLRGLLRRKGAIGFAFDGAGGIEGFILGRRGSRFTHLGPWVARRPEAAAILFEAALASIPPGSPAGVDIPAPNEEARALARRAGLEPARTLWRMVREADGPINGKAPRPLPADSGVPPGGRPDRVFGLAGLEWG